MILKRSYRLIGICAALLLWLVLATHMYLGRPAPAASGSQVALTFERVPLDPSAPERRRLGSLEYLSGWALRSDDRRFGGISAIHIDDGRVIALSDSGILTSFRLPANGRETVAHIEYLSDGSRRKNLDSESLAVAGQTAWIALERRNAIWRFDLGHPRNSRRAQPAAMADWPRNGGPESMVRLHDGRFLVLSENARLADGSVEAVLFDRDPTDPDAQWIKLSYGAPAGYRPTDLAQLPDGRLLILSRAFSRLGATAAKLVVARLGAQNVIEGREIATFRPPITVDNMEALSITREDARTILWIASDDNFSPPLQRTLLMKFALLD